MSNYVFMRNISLRLLELIAITIMYLGISFATSFVDQKFGGVNEPVSWPPVFVSLIVSAIFIALLIFVLTKLPSKALEFSSLRRRIFRGILTGILACWIIWTALPIIPAIGDNRVGNLILLISYSDASLPTASVVIIGTFVTALFVHYISQKKGQYN